MFGLAHEREMVEEIDTDAYDSKSWSVTEVAEIKKIEHILSKDGFAVTLYLPTKSSKVAICMFNVVYVLTYHFLRLLKNKEV